MSVLKYGFDRAANSNEQVSFNRARADGMPFRGPSLPLREEEWEIFTEQVNDFDHGLFDISKPEDAAKVQAVCDRAANQWYQILAYDRHPITRPDGSFTIMIYLAWVAPHRELARDRATALAPIPVPTRLVN